MMIINMAIGFGYGPWVELRYHIVVYLRVNAQKKNAQSSTYFVGLVDLAKVPGESNAANGEHE